MLISRFTALLIDNIFVRRIHLNFHRWFCSVNKLSELPQIKTFKDFHSMKYFWLYLLLLCIYVQGFKIFFT